MVLSLPSNAGNYCKRSDFGFEPSPFKRCFQRLGKHFACHLQDKRRGNTRLKPKSWYDVPMWLQNAKILKTEKWSRYCCGIREPTSKPDTSFRELRTRWVYGCTVLYSLLYETDSRSEFMWYEVKGRKKGGKNKLQSVRSQSRGPWGLRRRSAATRLLRPQVQNPQRARMFASCICCVGCSFCDSADHSFRGDLPVLYVCV